MDNYIHEARAQGQSLGSDGNVSTVSVYIVKSHVTE